MIVTIYWKCYSANYQANGYHTYQASNVVDAIDVLKGSHVDLLITDMQMPGIHGLQLVKYAAEHFLRFLGWS